MPTLSGLQMKTWTDSLALKLLSKFSEVYFFLNFFELHSKCFELDNYDWVLVRPWCQSNATQSMISSAVCLSV